MLGITLNHKQPIYEQLVQKIETMVLSQVLEPNDPLPSIRELAAELMVNPNTIQKAYAQLESRDITYSVPGKGSFITDNVDKIRRNKISGLLGNVERATVELKRFGAQKQEVLNTVEKIYQKEEPYDTGGKSAEVL